MDNHLPPPFRLIIAIELAAKAHVGQRCKSDQSPYVNHLIDVMSLLIKFGHDNENLLISAVLHDAIENTTVNYDQLFLMFGKEVADTVEGLSNDKSLSMQERRLGQLRKAKNGTKNHKLIKLSDAISNAQSIPLNWSLKRAKKSLRHLKKLSDICVDVCPYMHQMLLKKIDLAMATFEENKREISDKLDEYIEQKRVFYCILTDRFYLCERARDRLNIASLMEGKFDAYIRSIRCKKLSFCSESVSLDSINSKVSELGKRSIDQSIEAPNSSGFISIKFRDS
jgi:guanosine-3',5'-bis(diphosphate) 3'-pyrophosphohydrolase